MVNAGFRKKALILKKRITILKRIFRYETKYRGGWLFCKLRNKPPTVACFNYFGITNSQLNMGLWTYFEFFI